MNSRKVNILAAVLISSILLLTAGIGTVYAYLSAVTADEYINTFTPAISSNPDVTVNKTSQKATASVSVPDAGYPVYVRAAVVVNWTKDGRICATPNGASYSVADPNWMKNGDFYYYNSAINTLDDEFEVTYTDVDGYVVQVQVIVQTIQAVGTVDDGTDTAVFDAWGVNISGSGS